MIAQQFIASAFITLIFRIIERNQKLKAKCRPTAI